jgi:ribonuclease P protein component
VLTAPHRLRDSASFRTAVRGGRRAGSRTVVVHLAGTGAEVAPSPARIGFVVGRAVGGATVRNRVKRRLRHLAREQLASLPDSAVLVVRALPPAAAATSAELRSDLGRCLQRVMS